MGSQSSILITKDFDGEHASNYPSSQSNNNPTPHDVHLHIAAVNTDQGTEKAANEMIRISTTSIPLSTIFKISSTDQPNSLHLQT